MLAYCFSLMSGRLVPCLQSRTDPALVVKDICAFGRLLIGAPW